MIYENFFKCTALISLLSMALLASAPASAQDAACKTPLAAMRKYIASPNHTFFTQAGGAPDGVNSGESIYTGTARYVLAKGQWIVNPIGTEDLLQHLESDVLGAKCGFVHDDVVAGEAAALYTFHHESDDMKSDNQIWISKRSGLPLKQESTVNIDGQHVRHMSLRMTYGNVQAPAGAKKIGD